MDRNPCRWPSKFVLTGSLPVRTASLATPVSLPTTPECLPQYCPCCSHKREISGTANKKSILLVEDDANIALQETRQLQKVGYDVIHSPTDEKGLNDSFWFRSVGHSFERFSLC